MRILKILMDCWVTNLSPMTNIKSWINNYLEIYSGFSAEPHLGYELILAEKFTVIR
jgi:hypothetical protein